VAGTDEVGSTLTVWVVPVADTDGVVFDENKAELLRSVLVVVFTVITTLVKFTLVTRGEAVNDDMITVGADVTLGCKVALVMFPTTDVMLLVDVTFNLLELDDDSTVLEGWINKLDRVSLEMFSDGSKELVMAKDLCVLVIVGTYEVVKNVDIGIGEVLFNNIVLSS